MNGETGCLASKASIGAAVELLETRKDISIATLAAAIVWALARTVGVSLSHFLNISLLLRILSRPSGDRCLPRSVQSNR